RPAAVPEIDSASVVALWSMTARADGSDGEPPSVVAEVKNALTLSAIVPLPAARVGGPAFSLLREEVAVRELVIRTDDAVGLHRSRERVARRGRLEVRRDARVARRVHVGDVLTGRVDCSGLRREAASGDVQEAQEGRHDFSLAPTAGRP